MKSDTNRRWQKGLVLLLLAQALAFLACQERHEGSEKQLKETADSFAATYYNWQFWKTARYCTDASQVWLRYAASNVHQADIDILRGMEEGANHELDGIRYDGNGATAVVSVTVRNFLQMDTIGTEAHLVKRASFDIPMRLANGKWLVDLRSLPRGKTER